jgi:hypothetical protein
MPQRVDNNTILILNMIYERQIKRMYGFFLLLNQGIILNLSLSFDLFVVSASDPTVFLDYASISTMNNTIDTISNPIDLEFWIWIVLDYLAFLHRILHLVNLDIKP